MSFQLVEIGSEQPSAPPKPTVTLGVILPGADGVEHFASDGARDFSESGIPHALPGGLVWICNMNFEQTKILQASLNGRGLRADNWLRTPVGVMLQEWGLSGRADKPTAQRVAQLLNRIFGLTHETMLSQLDAKDRDWAQKIEKQASLATAINIALLRDKKVEQGVLGPASSNAHKTGARIFSQQKRSPDTLWRFQAPRLTHARAVINNGVPGSRWQMVKLDGMDAETFRAKLRDARMPALVRVDAHALQASRLLPKTQETWFTSTRSGPRFWLTGDEILALTHVDGLVIEEAYVSLGAEPSRPVQAFLEDLASFGGTAVTAKNLSLPALSWSTGMVAENLLAAAMRADQKRTEFSSSFYAAHERIINERAARVLADAGLSVTGYQYGAVEAHVPADAEAVMVAADAAWRAGLLLPAGLVAIGRSLKLRLAGRPEDWGGVPDDLLLAKLMAAGQVNAAWNLDAVLDLPVDLRNSAFIEILKLLLGKR